jgi:hypothetical protein
VPFAGDVSPLYPAFYAPSGAWQPLALYSLYIDPHYLSDAVHLVDASVVRQWPEQLGDSPALLTSWPNGTSSVVSKWVFSPELSSGMLRGWFWL